MVVANNHRKHYYLAFIFLIYIAKPFRLVSGEQPFKQVLLHFNTLSE